MEDEILLKNGKIGILLIHGLSKSPDELKLIAEKLAKQDFTVYCPRLPGHIKCPIGYETCLRELPNVTYNDWEHSVNEAFSKLGQWVDEIYVGGISLGANLAVIIAGSHSVQGVISVAGVIYTRGVLTLGSLAIYLAKKILARGKGEAIYHGVSISKLASMRMAVERTKEILPKVRAPLLVMHSKYDDIVHPKSAKYIYKRANSNEKKLMWLESTRHGIDAVEDANIISEQIINFINKTKAAH
ncbi:MAG TPA: hypothetical protein EYP60_00665 [bacterium (Candidatus Stahlbacteria)]|nr:hypothetical protein [Candidatus Stahlbacteria bacterium]